MTDQPAGMDAIPADMPDSAGEGMQLKYDLQTFNALVAANTAMQSELAGRDAVIVEKDAMILSERERRSDVQQSHDEWRKRALAAEEKTREVETRVGGLSQDNEHKRDTISVLQRRIDRFAGYLDRLLDEEDRYHGEKTMTVPTPATPVGPDLEGLEIPLRRSGNDFDNMMFPGDRLRTHNPHQRQRRY